MDALTRYTSDLIITQGEGAGLPMRVLPWQQQFLQGAFADDVRTAALSVARGNGKTTLLAAAAAAAVRGPLAVPRGEVVIVASSYRQAKIAWDHAARFLLPDGLDRRIWKQGEKTGMAALEWRETGARVMAIGSDPARAHGLAPVLVLADEPAQWPESTGERMLAALTTALGKIPGSRMVALGTRPAAPGHWFQRWLDGEADFALQYAAGDDDDATDPATWAAANPSLSAMPELAGAIAAEAKRAEGDAVAMAAFRALRLNGGVSDTESSPLIPAAVWRGIETETLPDRSGQLVLGVDLGTTAAMSAMVAYWPDTGRAEAMAAFPTMPSLADRGRRDNVGDRYEKMAIADELVQLGGRVVDVDALLRRAMAAWGAPAVVVADRWREGELRDALDRAQVPAATFSARGMGYKDGGEDVRLFRRAVLAGGLRVRPSLLLRAAVGEARTVSDPAGNAKIAKAGGGGRRHKARDDAAVALVLAVAEGQRRLDKARPARRFVGAVARR